MLQVVSAMVCVGPVMFLLGINGISGHMVRAWLCPTLLATSLNKSLRFVIKSVYGPRHSQVLDASRND